MKNKAYSYFIEIASELSFLFIGYYDKLIKVMCIDLDIRILLLKYGYYF